MMVNYVCELLDTKTHRVVKRATLVARSHPEAQRKFEKVIPKKYDLNEMRTPQYNRYVMLTGKERKK